MDRYLRIGGVPEHFNLPWIQALEGNKLQHVSKEISWNFFPGGTGAMTQALQDNALDVAILLTEGYLAAHQKGLKAKIVQSYNDAPLVWGIYGNQNNRKPWSENPQVAISRMGSGSHLMALIHCHQEGFNLKQEQLKIIHHLEDGIKSIQTGETDLFYWEKYMTRPYVNHENLFEVGTFSAPWSGFLIVASDHALETKQEAILEMLAAIRPEIMRWVDDSQTPENISRRFSLDAHQAKQWLMNQRWNPTPHVRQMSLENAWRALAEVGMSPELPNFQHLCAPWITLEK